MCENDYYRFDLDGISPAESGSSEKYYFGTLADIRNFLEALEEEWDVTEGRKERITVLRRLVQVGETPFLIPAKILCKTSATYQNFRWEYSNDRGVSCTMRCSKAQAEHIWLQCAEMCCRCVKVAFTDLQYAGTGGRWSPVGSLIRGYPQILVHEEPFTWNRLAVKEKVLHPGDLPLLLKRWGIELQEDPINLVQQAIALTDKMEFEKDTDPDFSQFCDEIFGGGWRETDVIHNSEEEKRWAVSSEE
ncbi:MAG: hypothetical protein ACI4P4_09285 [Faecousia sp.]